MKSPASCRCRSRSSSKARRANRVLRVNRHRTDSAPLPTYVTDFLATSDGLALTKAFMRIKDAGLRRRIVNLVEEITGEAGIEPRVTMTGRENAFATIPMSAFATRFAAAVRAASSDPRARRHAGELGSRRARARGGLSHPARDQRGAGLSRRCGRRFASTIWWRYASLLQTAGSSRLSSGRHRVGRRDRAAFALRWPNAVAALALCAPSLGPIRIVGTICSSAPSLPGVKACAPSSMWCSSEPIRRTIAATGKSMPRTVPAFSPSIRSATRTPTGCWRRSRSNRRSGGSNARACCSPPHDQMRPPDQVKRYASLFRRAELALIDSGHIMVVQAPDAVAQAMRHSFARREAAARTGKLAPAVSEAGI